MISLCRLKCRFYGFHVLARTKDPQRPSSVIFESKKNQPLVRNDRPRPPEHFQLPLFVVCVPGPIRQRHDKTTPFEKSQIAQGLLMVFYASHPFFGHPENIRVPAKLSYTPDHWFPTHGSIRCREVFSFVVLHRSLLWRGKQITGNDCHQRQKAYSGSRSHRINVRQLGCAFAQFSHSLNPSVSSCKKIRVFASSRLCC
jgi:hypothetical protein